MEGLKPYPVYKESSLPWLGQVPATWEAHCLRTLTRVRNERNRPELPLLSVLREKGVVLRSSLAEDENHNFIPDDLSNYKVARAGNLVINKMKAWQGSMGIAPCDGIVSPAYYVFDFRIADRRYGQWLLRSRPFVDFFARMSDGVRIGQWDLSISGMRQIPLPVPPAEEQAAIVRYLDHATRKIDQAIRAKRKIIALLNEQKQAIIHRAVTRGLDPDVPLKDSGIPWLGQIPAHWGVSRLKFETSAIVDCLHATPKYEADGGYPAIRTADIEPGGVRLRQARQVSRNTYLTWTSRLEPRGGDILYSREGERFGIAAPVPNDVRLCISQRMMVFRVKPTQLSDYIMWQLNCPHIYAQASVYVIGSTAPHVNIEQIKNYFLALPPVDEQKQIADFIATECSSLDNTSSRIEREIFLLREYRTRLIADVVTGKLDVREATARLPEPEAEEAPEIAEAEDDEEVLEEAA